MGLTVGSWTCYIIGQFLHGGAQFSAIKNAHKATWKATLAAVWISLGCRVFVATMLLIGLAQNPDLIYKLVKVIGMEPENTSLHMSAPIAGIFGYAFDNILTYIPFLKGQVPVLDPPAAP